MKKMRIAIVSVVIAALGAGAVLALVPGVGVGTVLFLAAVAAIALFGAAQAAGVALAVFRQATKQGPR